MYLQLDTQFNPFTYDEMVKPLLYYKEAYDTAEAAYSDLATQTEAWKDIANRENNPIAYEMYNRYSTELNSALDDFKNGMTMNNGRRALLGLKRRYAQEILPIARASEAMKAANELRDKAGPDAVFEVGRYNSIDDFLNGQVANNRYQSKTALAKEAAVMTEAAMAEAMKNPEFIKAMGDQYWEIVQHSGGSYKDLQEALKLGMMDNPIANNIFSEIRQSLAKKYNISNYDSNGQKELMNSIDLGLFAGLDKPTIQYQANQAFIPPLSGRIGGHSGGGGRGRKRRSRYDYLDNYEDEDGETSAYLANNIVYGVNGETGEWSALGRNMEDGYYIDPSEPHGKKWNYDDLQRKFPKSLGRLAKHHIGNSDPNQYEFYVWKHGKGQTKQRLQIMRRPSRMTPGGVNKDDNRSDARLAQDVLNSLGK